MVYLSGSESLKKLYFKFVSDHFMPVLVKSLRSQRVRHVTAGEYHTAVLTEVQNLGPYNYYFAISKSIFSYFVLIIMYCVPQT